MAGKGAARTPELLGSEAAARSEQELTEADLGSMFQSTEEEIFQETLGAAEPENTGDRTLEQMSEDEAGDELEDEQDPAPAEDVDETGEEDDAPTGEELEVQPQRGQQQERRQQGIPPGRLREETTRRRSVEQQLADEREARLRLEGELRARDRQQQQPERREQPQRPQKPDMFADPDGYEEWLRNDIRGQFNDTIREERVNLSMGFAQELYGEEFTEAYQSLQDLDPQNPEDRRTVQSIVGGRNPGVALMKWHRNREIVENLGDDPAAFIEAEVERRLQERLAGGGERQQPQQREQVRQSGAGDRQLPARGGPVVQRRVPRSLNGAPGSGTQRNRTDPRGLDGSEGAIFDYVFSPTG